MGYTHYWRLNKKSEEVNVFSKTVEEMVRIVETKPDILAGWDGDGEPEMSKQVTVGEETIEAWREISFNGKSPDDYESFLFERFGNNPMDSNGDEFSCCKTSRYCSEKRPYDIVVVACLAVAAENLGKGIKVTSDGDESDWREGVELASEVLGRVVSIPQSVTGAGEINA